MIFIERGGRRYAQFERLAAEPGLVHAFSTRPQDVGARSDDRAAERAARRRAMALDLGLSPRRLCYCVQVHETAQALIDAPTAARRIEGVDAIITDQPDTPVMSFSADCPLVLVYDPLCRVVGLVHSSWRCTVAFSTRKLVETLRTRFGSRPHDLRAGVGPSAGPERYEVKQDVYDAAAALPDRDALFRRFAGGRMCFDLWEANRRQLVDAGLRAENIEIAGICTMSEQERFYSFRREGPGCGHFGLMAGLCGAP